MPVGGLGGTGPGQSELGAALSRLCWVDGVQGLSLELGSEGRWEGPAPEGPGRGLLCWAQKKPLVQRPFPAGVGGTRGGGGGAPARRCPPAQASL